MEELFEKIGETILMEIDEIKDVTYMDKEMGDIMLITLNDGRKYILSLISSNTR